LINTLPIQPIPIIPPQPLPVSPFYTHTPSLIHSMAQLKHAVPPSQPRRSLGGGGSMGRGGALNVARRGGARSGGPSSRPSQSAAGAQRTIPSPFLRHSSDS
jgi:hypothetical protein